ncbi:hypothetical protein MSG28_011082 [Choristoneura fumiferana]|uniref:Uncharacterized protein n=1 Tax=Choristoneura fumiferana TaxID=7141 RepID=A0ACC0KPZ8_CHOFU|nr:hypothetical protein MSG28_011082 [Choristoneura fumiferana]
MSGVQTAWPSVKVANTSTRAAARDGRGRASEARRGGRESKNILCADICCARTASGANHIMQ